MTSNVLPLATVAAPVAGPLAAAVVAAIPAILRISGVQSGDPGAHRSLDRALGWLPGLALIGAAVACARFPDDSSFAVGSTPVTIGPVARAVSAVACALAGLVALLGAVSRRGSGTAIAAATAAAAIVVAALAGDITRIAAAGIHVAILVVAIAMATSGTGMPDPSQGGWRGATATLTLGSLGLVIILAGLSLADVLRVSPGGLVRESFVIAVLAVGFALAIGLPPLHFWIPVAAWRPGTGSSMIALGLVVPAAVGYLVQVLAAIPQLGGAALTAQVLTVGGLVACVVGASGALAPGRLGRRVGYAAIAGIGPVLLGLGTGTRIGVAGALVALAHHAVCTIILVATAPIVEAQRENPWSHAGGDAQRQSTRAHGRGGDAGQARLHRVAFILGAVAASGVPPLGGFASRWAIMQALSLSDWRLGMAAGITALATLGALLSGATRTGARVPVNSSPDTQDPLPKPFPDAVGEGLPAGEGLTTGVPAAGFPGKDAAPAATHAEGGGALLVVYALAACAWGVVPSWAIEHAWRATAQLGYLRPF